MLLHYYDRAATGDTTAPTAQITVTPSRNKISSVIGFDATQFEFSVDEDYQAYEVRLVNADSDPRALGTLIETGTGGTAATSRAVAISHSELSVAGQGAEGTKRPKVFVQDLAGLWST